MTDDDSKYQSCIDVLIEVGTEIAAEKQQALAHLGIWRDVAVALANDLADVGADPCSSAVLAYNHARNGRMAEAAEELS